MRLAHRLLFILAALLAPVLGWAQSPAIGIGSTWRAQYNESALLVRVGDEQIDLHHVGSGKTVSVPAFPTPGGLSGMSGSEVVSLGNVLGQPVLLVGSTLLPLTRIPAIEYAAQTQPRPVPATAAAAREGGGSAGSLGGVALLYARSNNGYGQMKRFDFCSDGSFRYHFEELQSSQSGRAAGNRDDSGMWSLDGDALTVRFRGQEARSYRFAMRSNISVSLDGAVFAAERSGRCR